MRSTTPTIPSIFECPELEALYEIRDRADETKARAAAWIASRDESRAAVNSATELFTLRLDGVGLKQLEKAQALAESANVAAKAVEDVGGPDALRRRVLNDPVAFELFTTGFGRRVAALEKIKAGAVDLLAKARSQATLAGGAHSSILLDQAPVVVLARDALTAVQNAYQGATVAKNATANLGKSAAEPKSFEVMLTHLESPLPVLPVLPVAETKAS